MTTMTQDELKRLAARAALRYLDGARIVGVGTGSTVKHFIDALAERLPLVPQVAAFDTAFHASLPEAARTYAIPRRWTREWACGASASTA